jgi:thymidylate synthase
MRYSLCLWKRYTSTFLEEQQYLNLIKKTISQGDKRETRNGTVLSTFGYQMRFNLRNQTYPLLTTKAVAWKTCMKELFWFIKGSTDVRELTEQNVHIWDTNAGGEHDLGPIYGHQWRHYNAPYDTCDTDYRGKGVDQLQQIIDALGSDEHRTSRRLILNAWNPVQINEMNLPPCHVLCQFWVNSQNELHTHLYQRSGDIGLGVPFNIASYTALTHIIAHHCDLKPGEFIHTLGDAHIYETHINPLILQTKRKCRPFPTLFIKDKHSNIENYSLKDLKLLDYYPDKKIEMQMIK